MARLFILLAALSMLVAPTSAAVITWNNEGGDGLYSNPDNWDLDRIPTEFDDVVFDGTSSDDCLLTLSQVHLASLSLLTGFTGTFDSRNHEIYIHADMLVESGTYTGNSGVVLYGDMIQTGGSFLPSRVLMRQNVSSTFQCLESPLTISAFDMSVGQNIEIIIDATMESDSLNLSAFQRTTDIRLVSGTHITLGVNSSYLHQQARVILEDNAIIDARTASEYTMFGGSRVEMGSGTLLFNALGMSFTDSTGTVIDTISVGGDVFVTLIDLEENLDATLIDEVSVTVTSPTTGDEETLLLQETGINTGAFRNSSPLLSSGDSANPGDNILQFQVGEDLTTTYIDEQDPTDTITRNLQVPDFVWDGEGTTNSWFDADNWSSNTIPSRFDNVRFDGTSSKTAVLTPGPIIISNFTVTNGYTGSINFDGVRTTEFHGDFLQSGGSIDWGLFPIMLYGDFRKSAGSSMRGAFQIQGAGIQEFDVRPNGIAPQSLDLRGPNATAINLRGDITFPAFTSGILTGIGGPVDVTYSAGTIFFEGTTPDFRIFTNSTFTIAADGLLDIANVRQFTNQGIITENPPGVILLPAESLFFTNEIGNVVGGVLDGEDVYITLEDLDENLDGNTPDTTTVTVRSIDTSDEETIVLTETGTRDAVFRNAIPLPTQVGAANPGDGILQKSGDEELTVTYIDNEDATDVLVESLIREPIIWDGGGTTNDWDEPENWNTDAVPGPADDVIFNATSIKNCQMTPDQRDCNNFTIEAGYTGTIFQNSFNRTDVRGDFTQHGGTMENRFASWTVRGNIVVTSGTFNMLGLTMIATDDVVFDVGPNPVQFNSINWDSMNGSTITVPNDLSLIGFCEVLNNATVILDDVEMTCLTGATIGVRSGASMILSNNSVLDMTMANGLSVFGSLIEEPGSYVKRLSTALFLSDSDGNEITTIGLDETLYVMLSDEDENTSGIVNNISTATISTVNSGDRETIQLQEVNSSVSALFRNIDGLPMAFGAPIPENGILEVNQTEQIRASYTDDEDPSDTRDSTSIALQTPEISVTVSGTPISNGTGPIDLGSYNLGSASPTVQFTIRNVGQSNLSVSSIGATGGFTTDESGPLSIAPGNTTTIQATLPDPPVGDFEGTISINNNDFDESLFTFAFSGSVVAPELQVSFDGNALDNNGDPIDLGTYLVGGTPIVSGILIENIGTSALLTSPSMISGNISVTMDVSPSISTFSNSEIVFSIPPTHSGPTSATITINSNDPTNPEFTVNLTATGLAPEIHLFDGDTELLNGAGPINFGTAIINDSPLEKTFTISNQGTSPLTVTMLDATGAFQITDGIDTAIPADAEEAFTIQLPTTNTGEFQGTVSIASNDPFTPAFTFTISGTVSEALIPELKVFDGDTELASGASLDLGFTEHQGAPIEKTLTIRNVGNGELNISDVSISSAFDVTQFTGTIAPSASQDITIDLGSSLHGEFMGTMQITSDDPTTPLFTIDVSATVTEIPELAEILAGLLGSAASMTNHDLNEDGIIDAADVSTASGD